MYVVRVDAEKRLRRLKSGDHLQEKSVCERKECGPTDSRGNQRLGIVLVKTAPDNWIDHPQKWSSALDSESIIESKTDSFEPSEESDSNVEVTGDPL